MNCNVYISILTRIYLPVNVIYFNTIYKRYINSKTSTISSIEELSLYINCNDSPGMTYSSEGSIVEGGRRVRSTGGG